MTDLGQSALLGLAADALEEGEAAVAGPGRAADLLLALLADLLPQLRMRGLEVPREGQRLLELRVVLAKPAGGEGEKDESESYAHDRSLVRVSWI